MIALHEVMTYRVAVRGPLEVGERAPGGARQYWEMAEATLTGDGIRATLARPGSDWMGVSGDGYWRPDVRVVLRTDDGATVLLRYVGLVEQTTRFLEAAAAGGETGWDDQYMRMTMTFETGDERYRWLNERLFVAQGRLAGAGEIEYAVYRVG